MGTSVGQDEQERQFGIEELFFSTTDRGGRIITGNPVFVRVSGYSLEEMVGRPHNIIRNPDMPRIAFRLLWESIEGGRPFAAYVKNRAKDGLPYWVVATVVPVAGGYLSVRFKPSGRNLPVVKGLYRELKAVEDDAEARGATRREAMDRSADALAGALEGLGLPDYEAFMHLMLGDELASRDAALAERTPPASPDCPSAENLEATLAACTRIHDHLRRVFDDTRVFLRLKDALAVRSRELAEEMRLQSLNMLISTARIGEGAATLGAVAGLMAAEAETAAALNATLNARAADLDGRLRAQWFLSAIGRLLSEQAMFFAREMLAAHASGAPDAGASLPDLEQLDGAIAGNRRAIATGGTELAEALERVAGDVAALDHLLGVLDTLQVNGLIEAARIDGAGAVVPMLRELRAEIGSGRDELAALGRDVAAATARARAAASDPALATAGCELTA